MDPAFFDLLNLEQKSLGDVKSRVQAGEYDGAAEEFLAHMRQRTQPRYYNGWENRTLNPHYDTAEADKICRRHLVHVDVGPHIDWHLDPHGDPEWTYCLNRHQFLTELGRAYWYTGREKYTVAFKELLLDWIAKNPPPDVDWMLQIPSEQSRAHFMKQATWRPISAGIRLYTAWCPCYYHFLHSPLFTPDFHTTMLSAMADHARYLRRYYTRHVSYFNVSPNWGLMEANGLAHMGILFPEFKEAEDWRNTALSRLEEQVRMQVLPDGTHVERCSGYHLVAAFALLQILELARLNGLRISDTWMANQEKMIDFVLYLMKPHGVYPMLSDGDQSDVTGEKASYGLWEDINNLNMLEDGNDLRYVLQAGARLFQRPDMLYVATRGRQGAAPDQTSAAFPDGGFYISRSGWQRDDHYLVVNCGLLGVYDQNCVHGHADALSIDAAAFGQTLIIDPGRYLYEGPYRLWFKGTSAHNTVVVDGLDQSELADEWMFKSKAVAHTRHWCSSEHFDFFDGSHDGYQRLPQPLTHRRRILCVKSQYWLLIDDLLGPGRHDLDLFFHLPPEARVDSADRSPRFRIAYPNHVGLQIIPAQPDLLSAQVIHGAQDPIQGWVSYNYAVKQPAPVIHYRYTGHTPVRLVTALVPFRHSSPDTSLSCGPDDTLEISTPGYQDIIILNDQTLSRSCRDFEFDGQILCARFTPDRQLTRWFAALPSLVRFRGHDLFTAQNPFHPPAVEKILTPETDN